MAQAAAVPGGFAVERAHLRRFSHLGKSWEMGGTQRTQRTATHATHATHAIHLPRSGRRTVAHPYRSSTLPGELRDLAHGAQPRGGKYQNLPEKPGEKNFRRSRFLFNRCCATARISRNPPLTSDVSEPMSRSPEMGEELKEARSQKPESRSQKPESRSQNPEARIQKRKYILDSGFWILTSFSSSPSRSWRLAKNQKRRAGPGGRPIRGSQSNQCRT